MRLLFWFAVGVLITQPMICRANDGSSSIPLPTARETSTNSPVLDLAVQGQQYFSGHTRHFRDGAVDQSQDVLGRLRVHEKNLRVDLGGAYRGAEAHFYPHPKEIHWTSQSGHFHLGQKRHLWSRLDEAFHLGLWEARFTDDKFSLDRAGLIGAWWTRKQGIWSWALLISPMRWPELGPDFGERDGKFVSRSPWMRPPTDSVYIQNVRTDIHYRLIEPTQGDVIFQPGAAVQIGAQMGPSLLTAAYGFKPVNQFLFGFPLAFNLGETPAEQFVSVDVYPRTLYHHVLSVDARNQFGEGGLFDIGATLEGPVRDKTPGDWLTQETGPATIGYISASQTFGYATIKIDYLRVWGGDRQDRGAFVSAQSFFEPRYFFSEAVQLGVNSSIEPLNYLMKVSTSLLYEVQEQGVLWRNHFQVNLPNRWRGYVQLDMLGLLTATSGKERFISNYRSNDRLLLGVGHEL